MTTYGKYAVMALVVTVTACASQPPMTEAERAYQLRVLEEGQRRNQAILQDYANTMKGNRQPIGQAPANAYGTTVNAFWTGRSNVGQSVTGQGGFNCEYEYAGRKFWRFQIGGCASPIAIQ
jgi:hypothetical protein